MKRYRRLAVLLVVTVCAALLPYDTFAQEPVQTNETAEDGQTENETPGQEQENEETKSQESQNTSEKEAKNEEETGKEIEMEEETAKEIRTEEASEEMEMEEEAAQEEDIIDDDPGQFRLGGANSGISTFTTSNPSFENYAHPAKYSGYQVQRGIDVSKYQETIDWNKVKSVGIQFAFIRVGYRGYGSAGTLNEDSYYVRNLQGAIQAGIPVGVYMFSQAITVAEAEAEAAYILDRIKGYQISLPVVIDYEFAHDGKNYGRLAPGKLSKAAATNICNAFCTKVKAAGYTPMVYADKNMLTNYLNASGLNSTVWLAHYTSGGAATNYTGDFEYWQFTSSGSVSGISGKADLNFRYVKPGSSVGVTAPTTTPKGPSVTPLSGTGITNGTSINVRKGPGTSYGSLTRLGVNKSVALTGETGSWYQVSVNVSKSNKTGYIQKAYITQLNKPALSSAKAKSKSKIRVKWGKVSGASGYQIQRKTSGGSYKTVKTVKKGSTVSYTNSGLKKNKTYKYRVRAYKKVRGRKIYSSYSKAMSVKTKKK